MIVDLRRATVVMAMVIATYGIVSATDQASAGDRAQTNVELPAPDATAVLVDDAHQQVFVGGDSLLVVAGFDGRIVKTVEGRHHALTINRDGSQVYATGTGKTLHVINTATIESRDVDLGVCATSLAFTSERMWFLHNNCFGGYPAVGVFDPGTGEVRTGLVRPPVAVSIVRAVPGQPDRLAVVSSSQFLEIYDTSTDPPTSLVRRWHGAPEAQCVDAALASNGDLLITACMGRDQHDAFHTSDLSLAPALRSGSGGSAVTITPDGRYVAAGFHEDYQWTVHVYDVATGTPGILNQTMSRYGTLTPAGLGLSETGRLFAAYLDDSHAYLSVFENATKHITRVSLSIPSGVDYPGRIEMTGAVSYPPGTMTSATLTRIDRNGSHDLGTVEVAPDGTFSFTETVRVTGWIGYRVEYQGDETHPPATGLDGTFVRALSYDFNADGRAETAVGAPGEDIGTAKDAGMLHVFYGGSSGLAGSRSVALTEGAEPGDQFGYAHASGDFDADGYADLAVSAPGEDVPTAIESGAVWLYRGSADGLLTEPWRILGMDMVSLPLKDHARFGHSLAAGHFTGTHHELAVGIPGVGPGHTIVYYGEDSGDPIIDYFSQDSTDVPGEDDPGDRFGWSIAAGDVSGDGRDDLAVGAPGDFEDRGWATGSATVFYSGRYGLGSEAAQRWTKETAGVPGASGSFNLSSGDSPDEFGRQVSLADVNGDGHADLAVGAPGAPVAANEVRKRDAGTVTLLYSREWLNSWTIQVEDGVHLTQQSYGMPGIAGQEDHFGTTLAATDSCRAGARYLAIFSPGDTYVSVMPQSPAIGPIKAWTQDSPGIPGSSEAGDNWGGALRFADVKGTGYCSLVVGASGENSGQGAITAIHSSDSGPTGTGAQWFSQDSTGVPGVGEPGDHFGASL